jgi:hypothetical protein
MDFRVVYSTMPDDKLKELLEKYIEKCDRCKKFVNEETERSEEKLLMINNELKSREEFRKSLYTNKRYKHFVDEEE